MLSMRRTIKGKPPRLPFLEMKNAVLGKEYDLSLVFIGSTRSRTLNKTHRGKNKPANVLSFPLSEDAGEMFIDLAEAQRTAKNFNKTYEQFIGLLFIHGLFHLKGLSHGDKMENEEEKVQKKFNIL